MNEIVRICDVPASDDSMITTAHEAPESTLDSVNKAWENYGHANVSIKYAIKSSYKSLVTVLIDIR